MANFTERISVIIDTKMDAAATGFKKLSMDVKAADGVTGKFKAGWSNLTDSLRNSPASMAIAGAAAIAMAGQVLEAGVALEQMDAKADAVFGDSLGDVSKWAEENAGAFGLTERSAINAAAGIADLLKPMGFTTAAATEQTIALMDLSASLAAWSAGKYDAAEVSEILAKAMLGEREQLKSLGISITEADVSARLAEKGQKDLTGAALAQAKAMATQELIMEKSTDAQKAWNDGSMDGVKAANESKAKYGELSETLTEALYPIVAELAPAVAELATELQPAAEGLADVTKWAVGAAKALDAYNRAAKIASLTNPLTAIPTAREWAASHTQIDTTSASLEQFTATMREHYPEVGTATNMLEDWVAANGDAGLTVEELEAAIYGLDDAFVAAHDAGDRGTDSVNYYTDALGNAVDIISAASTATNELTDAGKGAGPAMDDLRDALDDAASAGDDLETHLKGVRDILDELNEEEAALDLADQMDATKKAAEEAFYAGVEGAEDFAAKQRDAQREAIELKRKVIEYGDSIGGIPAEKLTEINALIDAGDVDAVQRELDRLTQARTVTLFLQASGGGSGYGGGGSSGAGTGGGGAGNGGGFGKNNLEGAGASRGGIVVNVSAGLVTNPGQIGEQVAALLTTWANDGGRAAWMGGTP